jgi:hypothetical protein
MLNKTVAAKSAWKTVVTTFFMSLGVAILGTAAEFLSDADVLSGIFGADPKLLVLVPIFGMLGQFLKDYIKHA